MRTIADEAIRDAKWAALGVAAALWGFGKIQTPAFLLLAAVFLAQAVLLWKCRKAGAVLALLTAAGVGMWFVWGWITKGFTWIGAAITAGTLVAIWAYWDSYGDLLRGKADWQDPEDKDERGATTVGDENGNQPMTSIVLLRTRPKWLDAAVLLEFVRDAWDEDRKLDEEALFVAGDSPLFIIKSPQGMWMLHNLGRPYFDDPETAQEIPELRLRKAVDEHRAWLSVDLMQTASEDLPDDLYYPYIFRLIRELADDDTLAILRPESGQINVWSDEVAASLGSLDPLEEFGVPTHSPVIQIPDEDPRMKQAVETAKQEFGVFREHWAARDPEDSFLVKAAIRRDGVTEIIWIEVSGLEPDFIHGTLANQPVDLGEFKCGDTVEVPLSDLYDWALAAKGASEPLGLYTDRVVRAVEREERERFARDGGPAAQA